MIAGVTKPIEIGCPPIPLIERQAAAAAYIAGMQGLYRLFGQGTCDLDFIPPSLVTSVLLTNLSANCIPTPTLVAHTPDSQLHTYFLGQDNFLRRRDAMSPDSRGDQVPPPEWFTGSRTDRLIKSLDQIQTQQAHGINNGFVDREEVEKVFSIIGEQFY